jgi:hypothetical protein
MHKLAREVTYTIARSRIHAVRNRALDRADKIVSVRHAPGRFVL